MKSIYVICALLGITIGSLVLADQSASQVATEAKASDLKPTILSNSPVEHPKDSEIKHNDSLSTTPEPNTTTPTTTKLTTTSTTTVKPTTSTKPTTLPTPSTTPSTTTPVPTTTSTTTTTNSTPPKTTSSAPTTPTSVPTSASHTTALPTNSPLPSKDRHFDGLSFFGGIILATCLMAIAAFSWKFYRQCNEGNYRTL